MKTTSPHHRSQPILDDNYITNAIKALYCIPPELPYNEWFPVMASAKAANIPYERVNDWCSTASNYNAKDAESTWRSIDTTAGITEATLFYIAQQHGYDPTGDVDHEAVAEKQEQAKARQVHTDDEKHRKQQLAAIKADEILNLCDYAAPDHPYFASKKVIPRLLPWVDNNGWLVIPVMDLIGNVHSLQFISPDGDKRFLSNGAIKGNFYQLLSRESPSKAIVICEGYATGVTLSTDYMADCSVVVAFNANNLLPVANVFRAAFPDADIIIAGDNDKSGTGQSAAKAASDAVLGSYFIPLFLPHEVGSDFNDRWCLDNLDISHDD